VMLQRIPATLDADAVRRQLDELGYRARYDAVHVPMNRGSTLSMRYAFVNFVCPEDAARCIRECAGKPFGSSADVAPICNAEYARGQGAAYVLAQATKAKPKAGGVEGEAGEAGGGGGGGREAGEDAGEQGARCDCEGGGREGEPEAEVGAASLTEQT